MTFPDTEMRARIAAVRTRMEARGLDALLTTDPSNMHWLTLYDGWSFYVPQGVVVTSHEVLWWGRGMDAEGARHTARGCEIASYDDGLVQNPEAHPMEDLAGRLSDLAITALGVEMDGYYYSPRAHAVLAARFETRDATGLVNRCRLTKSPAEIALMRRAARISEAVIDGLMARTRPGARKNEVVAEAWRDAIRGTDGAWGDYPAIVPMLPSGPEASAPHLTWDGRPFRAGEATFFEISGCHRRYHAPLCRTIHLGPPPPQMERAAQAVAEALEAGLSAARPGAMAGDVARAMRAPLGAAGIEKAGRMGYSVGLSYPPDWGERTLSVRESDETVLGPGMTLHLMPGLWMDGWGYECTETALVREGAAAEALADRPRRLAVV